MSGKKQVFVIGGTGYVGASVIQRLVKHRTAAESEYTVLVRSEDKERKLAELVKSGGLGNVSIKLVRGSNADVDVLEAQAAKADVVFSIASSDDVPAIKAVLAGLKKRYEQTGVTPILIHTSGTGVIMDKAEGNFEGTKYYDDTIPEHFDTLADTQIHRDVDLLVIEADSQGYLRSYIIIPSLIYGFATGPLYDAGVGNLHSIAVPLLVRNGVSRGEVGVLGEGLSKWPAVHVDDTADLFITVYDGVISGRAGHGREGYYFAENGHYTWYGLSKATAEAMVALGKSKSTEPTPFTTAECEEMPLLRALGTNALCHANRGRALGWKPKYTVDDLYKSVKPEAEILLGVSS
ncbi:NAD(P)-binding protein [Coniophora puteana RWD-64-598 SS2]|uniref:NAD(P)-binding protein n=1 Tax=Coniophora puteana (strain RWD-64-598) TaxID=741705 RepID=A0A5M3MYC2_CONPW|nr:NAD(P)-binding protein [Coniophora puteana RWD-64-598 SS2]EIW84046.1 NAD(P)-binding protein [Coniophora puteana RWD-64-598 SS2]